LLLYSFCHCLTISLLCFFLCISRRIKRVKWNKVKERDRERERERERERKERIEKWEESWIDDDKVLIASSKSTLYPWLQEILFFNGFLMPRNNEILYKRILLNRRLIIMQIYKSIMLLDIVSLYIFIYLIYLFFYIYIF